VKRSIAVGRFQTGHPGGPGRPPGSRNKAYAKYDDIARDSMEEAVRAIGAAAASGDTGAARLLFGRLWPKAHDQLVEFELPPLEKPADLITAYSALLAAIARGEISPEQGARLSEILERKRLAFETTNIEDRLTALEEKDGPKPVG
jgi:hypothetical protein